MREVAQARDAERFTGRARELALLDRVLGDDPPATVALIHGPGGVGKSTLLREVIRRAEHRGYRTVIVDGREGAPGSGGLDLGIEALSGAECPLLVIDTFERISSLGSLLRDEVLPALPEAARVLIAGRTPPETAWSETGWDAVTVELPLSPLTDDDARALLERRGLHDPGTVDELVHWARGLPLALAVGADSVVAWGEAPAGERLEEDSQLATTLLRRLVSGELEGADRDVLAVAAIATAVDARLLGAVLPGVDGDAAEAWLRGLSFSESHGTRVTLHERVRAALRRELTERDPGHERELRRGIADHLHDRALLGEPRLVIDLAALIADPTLRWGFSVTTDRHRVDRIRPGDEPSAAARLGAADTEWWQRLRRFLTEAPDRVATVRGMTGDLAGLCISVTPANAPPWADGDVILGPWLAHARAHHPDGNVLIWRDSLDLTPRDRQEPGSPVTALLNSAATLRCGLPNVRWFYGPVDSRDPRARGLAEAIGARHVPELDVTDGERRIECHVADHGPDGVIGNVRAMVYRDLGMVPPAVARPAVDDQDVRQALRSFHDPVALAASPLARGSAAAARADSVRALLQRALAGAFGESADERLQRATIERGYLDRGAAHGRAMRELNLSRTTYFRRLAAATARIAEFVLAERR